MKERSESQIILDVMFEILSRSHSGEVPKEREELMEWARDQLRKMGIDVTPMGLSHAVLKPKLPDPADEALSFILGDFEFLHAGHMDRMARVQRFMDIVGLKLVVRK